MCLDSSSTFAPKITEGPVVSLNGTRVLLGRLDIKTLAVEMRYPRASYVNGDGKLEGVAESANPAEEKITDNRDILLGDIVEMVSG